MAPPRGPLLPALTLLSVAAAAALRALPQASAVSGMTLLHATTMLAALTSLLWGPELGRGLRSSRVLLAAALVFGVSGFVAGQLLVRADGTVPVPSVSDVLTLLWVPLALLGFWRVPHDLRGIAGIRALTDAFVASTALLFATWLVVLEPVLAQQQVSHLAVAVQTAYPVLDVFVVTVVVCLLGSADEDSKPFLDAVVCGLVLIALADVTAALSVARDGVDSISWADVPLQAGLAALALAPWRRRTWTSRRRHLLEANLAQVPVLVAVGAGAWYVLTGHQLDGDECVVGAAVLAAAVVRHVLHSVEMTRLLERQQHLANHDALTGLATRHAMTAYLAREFEHDDARGRIAVVKVDVDGLEEVNNSLGLLAGDAVLQQLAAGFQQLEDVVLAARIGGDDFTLLVPAEAAERVVDRVAGPHSYPVDSGVVDIVCSVGWAVARQGDQAHDLLAHARTALHAAKSEPRRRHAYTCDLAASAQRRRRVIANLVHAVERDELVMHYQAVHGLDCFEVVAVEALMRWTHEPLGAIGPGEFIPLAEDSGHIVALGNSALDAVLAQMQAWDQAGTPVPVAFVNLSPQQITPQFRDRLLQQLEVRGVAPQRLVLELTETSLSGHEVMRVLGRLRAAGVRVAIDDFGAGYSTLARLAELPVDVLKLDRGLVVNAESQRGRDVLRAAVDLGKALELLTVVEGIETAEQLRAVQASGADSAQGYLLSRPQPPESLAVTRAPWLPVPRAPRSLQLVTECGSPLSSTLCAGSGCAKAHLGASAG